MPLSCPWSREPRVYSPLRIPWRRTGPGGFRGLQNRCATPAGAAGGFDSHAPPHLLFSESLDRESWDEALALVQNVARLWIETAKERGWPVPEEREEPDHVVLIVKG